MASTMPVQVPMQPTLPPRRNSRSVEFDFLAACCYGNPMAENLVSTLNWDYLIQLARHHGVVPQLYSQLANFQSVPEAPFRALRDEYERSAQRSLWLTRELLRVMDSLAAKGIEGLAYKGPILAEMLYGNVAHRQFSDLDILLRAEDIPCAKAVVADLGYHTTLQLTPRQEREYLCSGYEYTFDSSHGRNLLELQWQILPRFYAVDFEMRGLFAREVHVTVAETTIRTLSFEDLWLTLCVHAAKHLWVRLSWLCDLARLAAITSIHWAFVESEAERLGVARIHSITLHLLEKVFAVTAPAKQSMAKEESDIADRILLLLQGETEVDPESLSYFYLSLRLRERTSDRIRFLRRLLLTPSLGEWESIHLPDPLFPLYRGVRLLRITRRLAR